jgi:hypothetical protein
MASRKRNAASDLPPDELLPVDMVKDLVEAGYRREAVERWTKVKARATIEKHRRNTNIATSQADGVARRNDGTVYPPPQPERQQAAGWIGVAMAQTDEDELTQALEWGIRNLARDEALRLASHMITRLLTVPALPEAASLMRLTKPASPTAEPPAPSNDGAIEL